MKTPAMHFAGALKWTSARGMTTYISAGFAACCTGDKTIKIRKLGHHTYDEDKVTCKSCLTVIAKAKYGPKAAKHPSTFKHYFKCKCGAIEIGSVQPIPESMKQCLECNNFAAGKPALGRWEKNGSWRTICGHFSNGYNVPTATCSNCGAVSLRPSLDNRVS